MVAGTTDPAASPSQADSPPPPGEVTAGRGSRCTAVAQRRWALDADSPPRPAHLHHAPALQEAGAQHEAIAAAELVPAHLLDGGEIVIFAIKPSVWFVVFSSFRWLAAMALIILAAASGGNLIPWFDSVIILQSAVLLAGARVLVAMMQWVSRLYVLTNRRILRLTGIFHVDLFECPLTQIEKTALTTAWYERLTGTGTILFATTPAGAVEVSWNHVDGPAELHERVRSAIHRAKSPQMR